MSVRPTRAAEIATYRERFAAEPAAMLHTVRLAGETGEEPAPVLIEAIAAEAGGVRRAATEVVAAELLRILCTPHPIVALETMSRAGLMDVLLPEVEDLRRMPPEGRHKDVYRHTLLVVARMPVDPIGRMAALLHDIGKPPTKVVERGGVRFPGHAEVGADMARRRLRALGYDKETIRAVTLLVALHLRVNSYETEWTDSAARRLAHDAGDQFERLLDLSRADVTSSRREAVERALRRVDAIAAHVAALREAENRPQSPLDGLELMAMFDRPPGRWIGVIKTRLAEMVGAGDLAPDDTEQAAVLARAMLAEIGE